MLLIASPILLLLLRTSACVALRRQLSIAPQGLLSKPMGRTLYLLPVVLLLKRRHLLIRWSIVTITYMMG